MTILFLTSISPLRRKHYEAFWFLHVLFVPLTIVFAGLHHPPVWWWCWVALGLWVGERTWRFGWWLYINGYLGIGGRARRAPPLIPPFSLLLPRTSRNSESCQERAKRSNSGCWRNTRMCLYLCLGNRHSRFSFSIDFNRYRGRRRRMEVMAAVWCP